MYGPGVVAESVARILASHRLAVTLVDRDTTSNGLVAYIVAMVCSGFNVAVIGLSTACETLTRIWYESLRRLRDISCAGSTRSVRTHMASSGDVCVAVVLANPPPGGGEKPRRS